MKYVLYFPSIAKRITDGQLTVGDSVFEVLAKLNNQFNSTLNIISLFKYNADSNFSLPENREMILFFIDSNTLTSSGFMVTLYNNVSTFQLKTKYYSNSTGWTDITIDDIPGDITTSSYYISISYDNYSAQNFNIRTYITEFKEENINDIISKISADVANTANITQLGSSGFTTWGFGTPTTTNLRYNNEVDNTGNITLSSLYYYIAQNTSLLYLQLWNTVIPENCSNLNYGLFNTTTVANQVNEKDYSIYYLMQNFQLVPYSASITPNLQFQLDIPQDETPFIDSTLDPPTNITNNSRLAAPNTSPTDQIADIIGDNSNSFQTLEKWTINENTTIIALDDIQCILEGTLILTPSGYRLIQDLKVGDFICTHDNRHKKIIKIHYANVIHSNKTQCVIIKKGTFGAIRDLYLSKNHAVLIGDEFIIPNRKMPDMIEYVNNISLYKYYSIMTDNYLTDSLIADGVPIETWGGYLPGMKNFKYKEPVIRNKERNRVLKK